MDYLILVINPGSTSTKVAIYLNEKLVKEKTLRHDVEDLKHFKTIIDQTDFRREIILDFLKKHDYTLEDFDVFVGRGGMMKPLKNGGTYLVTKEMLRDLKSGDYGYHASNLGAILADSFASIKKRPAYIVNPVCIDEFEDIARISGQKLISRRSLFHALNQKAIARRFADEINKDYHDINVIVAHLGGGISVGLHKAGRVVDCNNALGGDGPFSPERTGTIPTYPLVDICFSGDYTKDEVKKLLVGKGGLVSYLGTNDAREVEKKILDGDQYAKLHYEAMAYNVVKEIGSLYFANGGDIDGILITGGIAYSEVFIDYIKQKVEPIAKVRVYPGEDEMRALAEGAMRVLTKKAKSQVY
ncbi:MAG: butyrate kinase [Candidatus Izimaplasma sp.]|nr:butyrate kinase [Candidatus Izimaplasma bacterium]